MIPERFCIEYPTRVLTLLEELGPAAESLDLSTTFIVSLAMPMLVVPFERMTTGHVFSDARQDSSLTQALQQLKSTPFQETPFWTEADRSHWHFGHVVENINSPSYWIGPNGLHPLRGTPHTTAAETSFDDIIHTMRHGLSHGCVVYLDDEGNERPDRPVTRVAFLAKVQGGPNSGFPAGSRRLVVVEESALKRFLFLWCGWMKKYDLSPSLAAGA